MTFANHSSHTRPMALCACLALVGAGFGLLAWLGIGLTRDEGRIASVWAPNAVLLAVLLRLPVRQVTPFMAAAFVGNCLANLSWGDSLPTALGLSMANQIEMALVLWGLKKISDRRPDFCDNRTVLRFVALVCIASSVSGACAVAILQPSGSEAGRLWWEWMRADALGLCLLVPAVSIIVDAISVGRRPSRRALIEGAAIIAFGTAASCYTFWQTDYPFLFLDAPIVMLYAVRLGPVGNAIAIVNLALVASIFTALGRGPIHLVQGDLSDQLLVLQLFLASSFAVGLPVASLLRKQRELTEAKAQFLASMSHDIRTPMNGVIGFADLLRQSELTREQRQSVDRIAESGQTMVRLLNDILDYSRMEAGRFTLEDGIVNLREEVAWTLAMFEPRAAEKGLLLDAGVDAAVPQRFAGDPLRFRQVLLNIVGNAVKFTDRGAVTVRVRAARTITGMQIAIEVADTGIGIAPRHIARVFDKYEQAHPSGIGSRGGSGLGLAISRELVTLMHGRIEVVSHEGRGTVFSIHLPVREMPLQQNEETSLPVAAAA